MYEIQPQLIMTVQLENQTHFGLTFEGILYAYILPHNLRKLAYTAKSYNRKDF